MSATATQVNAGQAIYTRPVLMSYDLLVLGLSNRWIWRCPSRHLRTLYDRHVTGNHLDVGVGTGYFLDRCRFPVARPRLALMDLNPNCLEAASRRLTRYQPETYRANVLEPIAVPELLSRPHFDSIGMNYLLHCLPGSLQEKAALFSHLKPLLRPGGKVFGSTLLHGGVQRTAAARRLMAFYNAKGIFTNRDDDLGGLEQVLKARFKTVSIDTVGCVALFSAQD
jgi:SAM-dependent methyltransferase